MMNKTKCLSAIIDLLDEYMSDKPKPFTFLSYDEIYHGVCSSKRNKEAQKDYNAMLSVMAESVRIDKEARERAEAFRDTKFWEKRGKEAAELLNAKNEIERLKEKLFVISRPNNDPNFWEKASAHWVANEDIKNLKAENKTLRKKARQILGRLKEEMKDNEFMSDVLGVTEDREREDCWRCKHNKCGSACKKKLKGRCKATFSGWEAK